MLATRHEEYGEGGALPFILHAHLERTSGGQSGEQNWHEDMELQLCTGGEGEVTVAGKRYPFRPGDMAAIGGDLLHYTGTQRSLSYACLIVRASFCREMGIPYRNVFLTPVFRDDALRDAFLRLIKEAKAEDAPLYVARITSALLFLLCLLFEGQKGVSEDEGGEARTHKKVKDAIGYIREHYGERVTLDGLARHLCTDKYALCRDFKRMTGQTLFGYLNRYRCYRATERMLAGEGVFEAARACGFDNPSFFSKTYKKHMGVLPSQTKKEKREV